MKEDAFEHSWVCFAAVYIVLEVLITHTLPTLNMSTCVHTM